MMDIDERIELYLDMTSNCHTISYWQFDTDFNLLKTTSSYPRVLSRIIFDAWGESEKLRKYALENTLPLISSSAIGLMWALVPEHFNGHLHRIHLLGPLYCSDISVQTIDDALNRHYVNPRFRPKVVKALTELPILPLHRFYPYVMMLYTCITGGKILLSQIQHTNRFGTPNTLPDGEENSETVTARLERHSGIYAQEQELFKLIEEGNLNYKPTLNKIIMQSYSNNAKAPDPLQKSMSLAVTFINLSVRAAVRGGLPPSTAFEVRDAYETSVYRCRNVTEIKNLTDTMFEDFIVRVHNCKKNSNISKPIQTCCDYIDLHIFEKIELETLANVVGYTKYYLTRKFKSELDMSIWDYINHRKVERAKVLLADPERTIQDISDLLCYCSRSYFSEVFQQHTGFWPSDYRAVELKM